MVARQLIDKMILNELVGHAVTSGKGRLPGSGFYKPTLYFISRFAPWSLFTLAGLWRAWKSPNERHIVRRVERFLSCYFIFGLVIFSLSPHQRADHLLPLIPAAALLAGREIERWVAGLPIERLTRIIYTAAGIWLGLIAIYSGLFLMNSSAVKKTRSLENLAKQVRQQVGSEFPLTHLDDHYTLQFYLNTMRPQVSLDQAAKLLSDPDHAAFVATRKGGELRAKLSGNAHPLFTVAQWPPAGTPEVQILSNHPRLEYTQQMGVALGPYQLKLDGVHLQKTRRNHFYFWAKRPYGSITITNHSQTEQFVHLHLLNTAADETISRGTLKAGQSWTIPFGQKKSPEQSLTVGQIADCRQAYAHRRWLARNQAFTQLDYLFVNGDFVFESDWRYDLFLKQSREWSVPTFPVLGNHDIVKRSPYPRESFQNRFGYLTTWFDDGPARFVLLETPYKRLGKYQLEQLPKILSEQPAPPVKCIFQHVPPRVLQHEGPTSRADAEILLNIAEEEKVNRIYCGHVNGFKYHDHQTKKGKVRVLVSSGGGEKQYEKDYPLHWLKIAVTPQGLQDTEITFPMPSRAASIWALFSIKGLFLLQRFGSLILLILGITALFYFGAKWTLAGMHKPADPEA